MQPLELTKNQRRRLITMCNKVFKSKYGEVQLLDSYIACKEDHTGSPYLRWYIKKSAIILIEIHWFEFCCTYLVKSLFENIRPKFEESEEPFEDFSINGSSYGSDDILMQMVDNMTKLHPVDYLYENVYKKYVK
jgi:hypothetical protein